MTRLNALKHGLLSREVLLTGEDVQALEELDQRLRLDLAPRGELEDTFVDRTVSWVWRLKRAIRMEQDYIEAGYPNSKFGASGGPKRQDREAWDSMVDGALSSVDGNPSWLNLLR
ncbi:MAG: hypothetical protein ACUVS3_12045 [Thermodesulfobacteriota bacterium]